MGDQDHFLVQKVKEKIEKQLENSSRTFEEVSEYLAKEENANCLQILGSVIEIEEVFRGLVDRLTEEINNPETKKVPADPSNSSGRVKTDGDFVVSDFISKTDGDGNLVVPDCTTFKNVSPSWFSAETVTRVSGEIGGALIGTALLPGLGTVAGGIIGGKLSTSVVGMLSS